MDNLDPRLHFVVVTGIVVKKSDESNGAPKFLIAKRAPTEKAFPNKWTVPGGKFVRTEYEGLPKRPYTAGQKPSDAPQWYNLVEWVLRREVREEVNVEIAAPQYLTDLVFIRPDGYPVVTLSFWCEYVSGDAKPGKDLTEVAWVTAEEAKTYDLIEGIAEEIADVSKLLLTTNN
jgi:8-oxo-dGTP pyrophosphatase MutT (NUDIX family)